VQTALFKITLLQFVLKLFSEISPCSCKVSWHTNGRFDACFRFCVVMRTSYSYCCGCRFVADL